MRRGAGDRELLLEGSLSRQSLPSAFPASAGSWPELVLSKGTCAAQHCFCSEGSARWTQAYGGGSGMSSFRPVQAVLETVVSSTYTSYHEFSQLSSE